MEFWPLIDACRHEAGDNTELTARLLFRRLRASTATDVIGFVRRWEQTRSTLDTWPLTDAACLLLNETDDEDLHHVHDWIISHGHAAVTRIVHDPDNLVDLAADAGSAHAAWFAEFLTEAHIVVTGAWPLGYDPDAPDHPTGERTDLTDPEATNERFPRLSALRRAR